MQKIYPFKFLDAYERKDKAIFFGRNEEIEELYKMIFLTNILLVYGASGTGKTSLIQCGLANKFQTYDWLALNIRRGKNILLSLDKALCQESDDFFVYNENSDFSIEDIPAKIKAVYLASFRPIYLIFDQFEELYILGTKEEQRLFIKTIKTILKVSEPIKIIISIREEYLGYLYEFEKAVPELLRKKLRVESMNLDKVNTVIGEIGKLAQSNVTLKEKEEERIAQAIFDKIKEKENILSVQLPYLQVFLDKLYMQITQDDARQEEALFSLSALNEMGNIGDILRNFLDEQVKKIAKNYAQTTDDIWKMLSPFVSLEGTKEPITSTQYNLKLPKVDKKLLQEVLQDFIRSRILKFRKSDEVYEVTHDSLAKQIHAKRSEEEIATLEIQRLIKTQVMLKEDAREFFSEKQLLFIETYLSKLHLSEKEKEWIEKSKTNLQLELGKVKKRVRTLATLLILVFLCLLIAAYFYIDAKNNAKKAEEQTVIAKNNERDAKEQKKIAEDNEKIAKEALEIASTSKLNESAAQMKVNHANIIIDQRTGQLSLLKKTSDYDNTISSAGVLLANGKYSEAISKYKEAFYFTNDSSIVENYIKNAEGKQTKFNEYTLHIRNAENIKGNDIDANEKIYSFYKKAIATNFQDGGLAQQKINNVINTLVKLYEEKGDIRYEAAPKQRGYDGYKDALEWYKKAFSIHPLNTVILKKIKDCQTKIK